MSDPQVNRRVRRRSIDVQLQIALDDAAKAMTADISVQKLAQARLDCLLTMQARERHDKIRKLADELKVVRAENERLKEQLKEVATKTARPLSEVEIALQKYEREKESTGGRS